MFGTLAGGLLVGPWIGAWDLAWREPGTGLALLAVLLTAVAIGLTLLVQGGRRRRAFAAQTIQVRPGYWPQAPHGPADTSPRDRRIHAA